MTATPNLSLKTLLVPSKAAEVEYPGMPGFKIDVSFMSRDVLINIRKKATKNTFKNRQASEEFDDKLFLQLYAEAAIKNWKGLTLAYLQQLAPVDLSGQEDLSVELPFSQENALFLMQSSTNFDGFISETVSDLGNFSTPISKK